MIACLCRGDGTVLAVRDVSCSDALEGAFAKFDRQQNQYFVILPERLHPDEQEPVLRISQMPTFTDCLNPREPHAHLEFYKGLALGVRMASKGNVIKRQ